MYTDIQTVICTRYQFELWFEELMLPHLKKLEGKKLIIGDNVSSHISPRQSVILIQTYSFINGLFK
jgi:hypothetical protein